MSNGTLATSLLMGAVLVEFGLASISGPTFSGNSSPPQEQVTSSVHYITAPGEGIVQDDSSPEAPKEDRPRLADREDDSPQASHHATLDKIIPPVTLSGPPPGYEAPRAEIASDIDAGVRQLDRSVRELPGYTIQMVGEVEKHGIAALAYENPEMKRAGQKIGRDIGAGIGHLINALGKDMVDAAARR